MKTIPKLRFREFSRDWQKDYFGNVVEVVDSLHVTPREYLHKGFPMIRVTDVNDGELNLENCLRVSEEVFEEFTKKHKPKLGDIIMSRVGTCGASIKLDTNDKVCLGQNTVLLRPKIDNSFLHSLIRSSKIQNQVDRKVVGSTQKTLSLKDLKKFLVVRPTLPEQQKIASFLSAVDEKILQLTRKKELLEQYKKGAMRQLFSGSLRFKDKYGKPYPKWEEKKFGEVLKQQIREVDKPTQSYLAIGVRSHVKGTFQKPDSDPSKIEMDKLFVVKEDDLIVNITFAWEGAIAIVKREDDGGLVSHRFPTYQIDPHYSTPSYFSQLILDKQFRKTLELISPGGAGRNRVLSKKEFIKILWKFPCLEEQKKTANFLTAVDAKIESVAAQIAHTQTFKKGLLQQMFV